MASAVIEHFNAHVYCWYPSQCVHADFSYDSYKNQWLSMRITLSGSNIYYFVNGGLVGSGSFTRPTADKFYIKSGGGIYLDELRVTTGSLASASPYNPAAAPFDANKVLALPDTLAANTICVQHNTPVTICRVGGAQPQLYTDGNWINVTAMVCDGSTTTNALGFQFSPIGSAPDVDVDAQPERPGKPGGQDPENCKHNWEETSRTEAACKAPGSLLHTCSKCETARTEPIAKLAHVWEIKQTTQTTYGEEGNILTQGFTIYRCSLCGEEYKDTDGSGPPGSGTPDTPGDSGDGLWDKLGTLLGSVFKGLLDLASAILDGVLGGLIDLVTGTLDRLKELADLFGSFGEAMGVLWTWLPPEIMAVLAAGVTVFVFVALLKLFWK